VKKRCVSSGVWRQRGRINLPGPPDERSRGETGLARGKENFSEYSKNEKRQLYF